MQTPYEDVLLSFYKTDMISYLDDHPEEFEEAVLLAAADKQPYSWRSAWLLWSVMDENDSRIVDHIDRIINSLSGKKDGHQRELIKILSKMELNEDQEGLVFDLCVNMWKDIYKQPTVRFTALKMIVSITMKYPELFSEVALLTQGQYLSTLSPAVKKAVPKLLKELNK